MEIRKKTIVIWCGSAANQRALAIKIAKRYSVSGIVIDEKVPAHKKKTTISTLFQSAWDRFRFHPIYNAWKGLQNYYNENFRTWPNVPLLRVNNINSPDAEKFTRDLDPDMIIVSGTALVRDRMLQITPPIGIINLHTGLSPYVKGGPNCTNWCIARNEWHLTGNTIMWLNAGIDAGNIITSEHIDILSEHDYFEAHKKVMEHAHDLYLRAIDYLFHTPPPYTSIVQDTLGKGNLFLTKMWTAKWKKMLLKNWNKKNAVKKEPVPETVLLPVIK